MGDSVQLFFAGDFCSKPSTSMISVSEELRDLIRSCDIGVVNFEVPLRPEGDFPRQKRERYFQNDDAPAFLKDLGFNLFSLANNHAFDWDEAGFLKTKAALGDMAFGAGTYEEAYRVKVMEVNGLRIGFMGVCFAAYKGVFNDVFHHDGLGCAYINDLKVNHVIMEAKKSLDCLFVLPHDGIEYIDIPLPETIARYRDFIDYGADGVIASHPHCPQGWETYKGRPIFYSLGNFLFNSKEGYDYRVTDKPHWYDGICVLLRIDGRGIEWDVIPSRNVDNTGIIIDHDHAREEHDRRLCSCLNEDAEYLKCLTRICDTLGRNELSLVTEKHHANLLKDMVRVLKMRRSGGGGLRYRNALQRLMVHDVRRHLLIRTLKEG